MAKTAAIDNPQTSSTIILDVGANKGVDGLRLARENPDCHIFAFEPVPRMLQKIQARYEAVCAEGGALPNYTLVPKAVSDFCGSAEFNVAGTHGWGCSSLNDFSDGLNETWAGRTDLVVTEKITVDVTTLEEYFKGVLVGQIKYLHCDAQGSDLAVIRGMGEFRNKMAAGKIECASSREVALYKGQHALEDVKEDFKKWGFEILKIKINDSLGNEVNVSFRNTNFQP